MAERYPGGEEKKHQEDGENKQNQESRRETRSWLDVYEGEEITVDIHFEAESDGTNCTDELPDSCANKERHSSFLKVSDLKLENLPEKFKSQENIDLIRKKCDLTVKIQRNFTSSKRPASFHNTRKAYNDHTYGGMFTEPRCGTGTINRILTRDPIKGPCPCHLCDVSGNRKKEYYTITVRSSTHVVYDDQEAKASTILCFYNSADTSGVKWLYGLYIDGLHTSQGDMYRSDVCEIVCVTHDHETANMIMGLVPSDTLPAGVPHMFNHAPPPKGVIVSHPHGGIKRISFGEICNLTVPVEPTFQKCQPMPLPSGIICRLNLKRLAAKDPTNSSFDPIEEYTRMIQSINKAAKEDKTMPVTRLTEHLHSLKSTPSRSDTSRNATNTNSQPERQTIIAGNEESQNTSRKSLKEACGELFGALVAQHPFPPEFGHFYQDRSGFSNDMSIQSFPTASGLFQLLNPVVSSTETSLQSSEEHHSGESITNENIHSQSESLTNFISLLSRVTGKDEKLIASVADVMKDMKPLDNSLPVNERQANLEETFKRVFSLGNSGGVAGTGATASSGSATASSDGATAPSGGATAFIGSATASSDGATAPSGGATASSDGATAPSGGATAFIGGATTSIGDVTVGGTTTSIDGDTTFNDGATASIGSATADNGEHCDTSTGLEDDTDIAIQTMLLADAANNARCHSTTDGTRDNVGLVSAMKNVTSEATANAGEIDNDCDDVEKRDTDSLLGATANADDGDNDHGSVDKSGSDPLFDEIIADVNAKVCEALNACDPKTAAVVKNSGFTTDTFNHLLKSLKPSDDVSPEGEFHIPFGMNFILPQGALFAMRYVEGNPGCFIFPSGTKLVTPGGTTIDVVSGVDFKSTTYSPQFSYVTHTINTCEGSSGASVYCDLLENELQTFHPHFGKTSKPAVNISGVQENDLSGSTFDFMESMNRAILNHITDTVVERTSGADDNHENNDNGTDYGENETLKAPSQPSHQPQDFDLD